MILFVNGDGFFCEAYYFGVKVKRAIKVKELEIKKNNYAKKEVSL